MDIVVVGRHAELPEKFRRHVEEKLAKVEQLAPRAQRIDVEVTHENTPRLAGNRERVELTVVDSGPVVRAEATADDRYAALDIATGRLLERLRRHRDRRKDHRNNTPLTPVDVRPPQAEGLRLSESHGQRDGPPRGVAVRLRCRHHPPRLVRVERQRGLRPLHRRWVDQGGDVGDDGVPFVVAGHHPVLDVDDEQGGVGSVLERGHAASRVRL